MNNSRLTAKTLFKMADADRKLIVAANVMSTILTVSLIIKLVFSAICLVKSAD
ncbi:MAG: hypothetical protein J6L62_01975 [Clostridia bacterium]|nr:hypothetical protein [Clostridia bacterium]